MAKRKAAKAPARQNAVVLEEDLQAATDFVELLDEQAPIAAARGAQCGPLKSLIPVVFDVETYVDEETSLNKKTLRQYLREVLEKAGGLDSLSITIGDDAPSVYFGDIEGVPDDLPRIDEALLDVLHELACDPRYVFVAHNAAFDVRATRFLLGMPQPANVWCSMEGSMCCWPELPGGYSLKSLSKSLGLPHACRKYDLDLHELAHVRRRASRGAIPLDDISVDFRRTVGRICRDAGIDLSSGIDVATTYRILAAYNVRDVECAREVYQRQIAYIPAREQAVGLRTHAQRRHHLEVDDERLNGLVSALDLGAREAEQQAKEYLTDEQAAEIFNRGDAAESSSLQSIRYARLKNIVNGSLAQSGVFETTSLKKINPALLARNPTANAVLQQVSRAGKMMSHKRRSVIFQGVDVVDIELGPWRAHTYRFSSPSVGKGLNIHNIPKHDKAIAEPIRKTFRLPSTHCFVRADLANVEYRVEGLITGCRTVLDMFDPLRGGDPMTDPYCSAWRAMVRQIITKDSPIRQVAKMAVLGLGFCMSAVGYARVLLGVVADPKVPDVTEDTLAKIIADNHWPMPDERPLRMIREKVGCSMTIAIASFHIHRLFNEAHREFGLTANWLVDAASAIAQCRRGPQGVEKAKRLIDPLYARSDAPDRNLIGLEIDDTGLGDYPSLRVRCGPWDRSVCWREPHIRPTAFVEGAQSDLKLTIRKSTGQFKPFTRQLAIENVTQAAARNGMCAGIELVEKYGFHDHIHIHDELLLIVPRERDSVLKARDALTRALGPDNPLPMKWATMIKPSEITITQTLYEDEKDVAVTVKDKKTGEVRPGPDRWGRIMRNEPDALEALP